MTVNITIIGLGRIGASIGLNLAAHKDKITVTGYDDAAEAVKAAKKLGAAGRITSSLPEAVKEADLVILSLPLNEIQPVLKSIAGDLREDVLLVDTAPAKATVAGWVRELLPPRRHYVGLFPALNPQVLQDAGVGVESARADLFAHAVIAIAAPAGTDPAALKLASDLVVVLGAAPFYTDPEELDGMMAAVHTLPQLSAETIMQLTLVQPSWDDIRKLAGPCLYAGTALLAAEEPAALVEAAMQNSKNTVRVLDDLIVALTALRDDVAGGKKTRLLKRFEGVYNDRKKWLEERHKGDWLAIESGASSLPASGDFVKQQFFGGIGKLFGRSGDKSDEK